MENDAFSNCHPIVNLIFFCGAICTGLVIQHPAYLAAGVVCAAIYYLLLSGRKGIGLLLSVIPFAAVLMLINPLFNHYGERVLFCVLNAPYTLEALCYGAAIAAVFMLTVLWFACSSIVLTGDRWISLFGSIIPSLSLLLVMVLRMVPNLSLKAKQISGARRCIGRGTEQSGALSERFDSGMTVMSTLTSWALDGGIVTGDSMRARGYGVGKRTSFKIYRFSVRDAALLLMMTLLLLIIITMAVLGGASAEYTPRLYIQPLSGMSLAACISYCIFLLIPIILHIWEAVKWRISRSKI